MKHAEYFRENLDPKTVHSFSGHDLREATRMRFYRALHQRIARSDAREAVCTCTCINVSKKSAESQEDGIEPAAVNI